MYVGSPETFARRIRRRDADAQPESFDLLAIGRIPHEQRMDAIELYGREVIPRVPSCSR